MGRGGVALAGLLAASVASGEVLVRVSGDEVDIRAEAAPLADVLDRLGRQTGMKIVYEGPPPRQSVTVALERRSPTEAVLGLLEGQGLNFALVSDPTGTRVETLILAGAAGTGTSTGTATSSPVGARRRPFTLPPGASPDLPDLSDVEPSFGEPEEPPFQEPDLLPEELVEEGSPDVPSAAPPVPAPAAAAPAGTAVPGPVTVPFPGGQTFPVSPFAPQPFAPQPFPPAPPGTPGAPAPPEAPPTEDVPPEP